MYRQVPQELLNDEQYNRDLMLREREDFKRDEMACELGHEDRPDFNPRSPFANLGAHRRSFYRRR